jgi:nucleotide-binding universal stress UspA family protein
MSTVLAAIDNSLASRPVISAARSLASILGARIEAIHVQVDGGRTATETAAAAAVPLAITTGDVVEALTMAAEPEEIIALAIGARGTPSGRRPLGGTATAVATAASKPVLIVPPHTDITQPFRRVLIPLEGTLASSHAPNWIFHLIRDASVEAIVLHVHDESSIPSFTDQPQHEQAAWEQEFLSRYCPRGLRAAGIETRVGRPEEWVPVVAEQNGCNLIALGWSQKLEPGRAEVVRGTLERTRLPVLLVPVRATPAGSNAPPTAVATLV